MKPYILPTQIITVIGRNEYYNDYDKCFEICRAFTAIFLVMAKNLLLALGSDQASPPIRLGR